MPAKKVVAERQLELMTEFMEQNRGFAVGRMANKGPLAKQQAEQCWEELAATLNAVGTGATKSRAKWRDYWNEKKYAVRRKVTEFREHGRGTGGGPGKKFSLTPMEERIFAVLGKESVMGNAAVQISLHPTQPDTAVTSTLASAPVPEPFADPALTIELDCPFTESTSATTAPPADVSRPPPQLAPICSRSYTPRVADVPQWALQIEEQHLVNEDRTSRSLEAIAATLAAIQRSLEAIQHSVARIDDSR